MIQQHETVKTECIDLAGTRVAYRRFGTETRSRPLVLMQHYYGNMDHWDPNVTNDFARDREVVLFDYQGVGLSEGVSPSSVEDHATATTADSVPNEAFPLVMMLPYIMYWIYGFRDIMLIAAADFIGEKRSE